MEKMNKFVSLLLVFSLLLPYVPAAHAVAPVDEEVEQPVNPPGTAPGVICTQMGVKPNLLTGGVCCVGLELNQAGICDEQTFTDTALKSCSSDAGCSGGTGCYPQSASDLFSPASPSTEPEDDLSAASKAVMAQVGEVANPKTVGGSCAHAKECSSYSCVAGLCNQAMVCRYAKEGEVAPGGVNCVKGFIKGAGGKCEKDPDAANSVYLGLLNEPTINDEGQCRFELDKDTQDKAMAAMSSMRALEFFFATSNMNQNDDCFSIAPVLKNTIGTPMYETRKNILTNFTDVLNGIEFDFKQLIEASCKYRQPGNAFQDSACGNIAISNDAKNVNIHSGNDVSSGDVSLKQDGENISDKDLATRQTSGYDNLMMMYRRNLLFQSYEKSMLTTIQTAYTSLAKLEEGMAKWQSGSSSWDMMGTQLSYQCEGSKYKVRPFISWKTKYYTSVADRWANYWEVSGGTGGNADIIKRPMVAKTLAQMSGAEPDAAISEFSKKFYMIDPLMFGGMSQGSYGSAKALKKSSGFLGLPIFGGFKDLRHAYYIPGSGSGSFSYMREQIKPRLREFYKNLKQKPSQKGFIYEPELVTTAAKNCLDSDKTEKCVDFEKFLDDTLDEAFGQFIAYGHSNKDSYSGYFESASSYRRRLMAKIKVHMQNINEYYDIVIKQRDKQNICIERIVGGIIDSGILVTDDGGVQTGGSVKPGGTTSGSGAGTNLFGLNKGVGAAKLGPIRLSPLTRSKFSFDFTGNTLKKLNDGSNLDGIVGSSLDGGRASVGSADQAFLSAKRDAMKSANAKAAAKGVNLAKKEKAVKDVIASMKRGSGGASSGSGSGSGSGSRGGFGSGYINAGSAALGKDLKGAGEIKDGEVGAGVGVNGTKVGDGSDGKAAAGANAGANSGLAGIAGGFDPGAAGGAGAGGDSSGAGAGANGKDGTGLSDAEKEKMMSEYEKNKRDYEGAEDDGLFGKVSKAYVRNLDKVLIKKKKID